LRRSILPQFSEYPKNNFDIFLLDYPEDGEIVAMMIGDLLLTIQRRVLLTPSGETKEINLDYPDDETSISNRTSTINYLSTRPHIPKGSTTL
jgi:hypothetical protein